MDCDPDGTTIIVHVSEHSEGVKVPGIVWELPVGTVSVVVWGYVWEPDGTVCEPDGAVCEPDGAV